MLPIIGCFAESLIFYKIFYKSLYLYNITPPDKVNLAILTNFRACFCGFGRELWVGCSPPENFSKIFSIECLLLAFSFVIIYREFF